MVIDVLNMPAQMERQVECFGRPSEQIKPYSDRGTRSDQGYAGSKASLELGRSVELSYQIHSSENCRAWDKRSLLGP
jgi:hypothetical protein